MDSVGFHVSTRQEDDREALQRFKSNMVKDETTSKYIVGFPWVGDKPPTQEELDSNYGLVYAKFMDNMKSLDKNHSKLIQYKETHDKEVSLDFIERVPLKEHKDSNVVKHYINHFPVWRDESNTSKCRRVFDASLHRRGKACLNDKLYKGSQLTPHILKVLLHLRLARYLLSIDISKAFLRMVLKRSDRNCTCFFARKNWLDPNSQIEVWRFKSVLFGATSSPFMLNCTVADILNSNEFSFDLEVFVDNLFVLLQSQTDINSAAESLIEIFTKSSMPLHEFASNDNIANRVFQDKKL